MLFRSVLILSLLAGLNLQAQLDPIDVQIPMSDGKFLAGDLYLPNAIDTFPTIFIFTPYGKKFYALNGLPLGIEEDIENSHYAILVVDWRCRFASLSACSPIADDGLDGYDVIEWIALQSWSDGKVGMHGPSALGNVQFKVAKTQPPHLTCCVPEVASPQTTYLKYYPGGSLSLDLKTLDILFPGALAPILAFPHYNFIWDIAEANTLYPDSITVPMLLVGGWYDQNISQVLFWSDLLSSKSPVAEQHKTLIGPWVHGGTGLAHVGSSVQGELEYPEAENWNVDFAWEFFDHHMRGIQNSWQLRQRYTYFQMGDDQWNASESWPPQPNSMTTLYLQPNQTISTIPSEESDANLSFVYDPDDPSPTHGGKTLSLTQLQGPFDQSDTVEGRNDNLIFTTSVLAEDIIVQGQIKVNLFVASDRPDTDFVVRLTEVYPDGSSILLSDHIQRMRFREGFRVSDTTFM